VLIELHPVQTGNSLQNLVFHQLPCSFNYP
jgi:hypothetical protein